MPVTGYKKRVLVCLPKFFHEAHGGDAYCSYFKNIVEFECKNCPYLIFKNEAHDRMVKLAEKELRSLRRKRYESDGVHVRDSEDIVFEGPGAFNFCPNCGENLSED